MSVRLIARAIKHQIRLGRDSHGHYFITDGAGNKIRYSMYPTTFSGDRMVTKWIAEKRARG
jgi:hypothetical protein